jgi:hypothetical protein
MQKINFIIPFLMLIIVFGSCQKTIKLDMPEVEQSYVVEGRIETGMPPLVILTETQGYFEDASAESIFGSFVHNADVNVIANGQTYPLIELCSSSIPDSLIGLVSGALGIPIEFLGGFDFCVYTSLDPLAIGQVGVQYDLAISVGGKQITSTTKIPYPVPLDSVWFEAEPNLDSLGFVWAILSDPDTLGNNYRWYAKRNNTYKYGAELGQVKDPFHVAPLGSSVEDKFFNGKTFDFAYSRGEIGNIEGPDDEGPEEGYFKRGDTIEVKFCSVPREYFLYVRGLENQAASAGSPFASSGNLPNNIKGGLGIWTGIAPSFHQVICQ